MFMFNEFFSCVQQLYIMFIFLKSHRELDDNLLTEIPVALTLLPNLQDL